MRTTKTVASLPLFSWRTTVSTRPSSTRGCRRLGIFNAGSGELCDVQGRDAVRPGQRLLERRGELEDGVFLRGPPAQLDADREPVGVHREGQRYRGRAHDVVRQRELA